MQGGLWALMVSSLSPAGAEAGTVPCPSHRRAGEAIQGQLRPTPKPGPLRGRWLPRWARVAGPAAALLWLVCVVGHHAAFPRKFGHAALGAL